MPRVETHANVVEAIKKASEAYAGTEAVVRPAQKTGRST